MASDEIAGEEMVPFPIGDGSRGSGDAHDGAEARCVNSPEAESENLSFVAFSLPHDRRVRIVTAPVSRSWMLATHKQFANRCLPLLMANQSGWFLLNSGRFEAIWDGGVTPNALKISYSDTVHSTPIAESVFGYGILTWHVGYLFRTPPGFNLLVRGPANIPKDGISPLDGLVETDWAVATFTMNWKMTRVGHPVVFEDGEPFCMVVPQRRGELERFVPHISPIETDAELSAQWKEFNARRMLMSGVRLIALGKSAKSEGIGSAIPFERHYFEGTSPGGQTASEHEKKRDLRPFAGGSDGAG